jgi:hypothetical protein
MQKVRKIWPTKVKMQAMDPYFFSSPRAYESLNPALGRNNIKASNKCFNIMQNNLLDNLCLIYTVGVTYPKCYKVKSNLRIQYKNKLSN